MDKQFERVVKARQALANLRESTANTETKAGYLRTGEALLQAAKLDGDALVANALQPKAKSTFYRHKAALHHYLRVKLMEALVDQERRQKSFKETTDRSLREWKRLDWGASLDKLDKLSEIAEKVAASLSGTPDPDHPDDPTKNTSPFQLKDRTPRHSKRSELVRLPPDWRAVLAKRLHNHEGKELNGKQVPPRPYRTAFLLCGIVGLRPSELKKGVRLDVVDGELVVEVKGAKVRQISTKNGIFQAGQETRTIRFKLGEHPFVDELAKRAGSVVQIADTQNFSEAVKAAGKRQWPKLTVAVRPYSARHAAAADWKAFGMSPEEVAAGLGHATDKTGGLYGEQQQGKRRGGVKPSSVEASKAVRKVKKDPLAPKKAPNLRPR